VLDADKNWKMLAEQSGEWQGEKAMKFAQDWLSMYGDKLNAILSDNDDMSTAVKGAVNQGGRSDIICIGIDGTQTALQMVKSGQLDGSILQDANGQGTQSVDACADIIQGKTVQKSIMVPFVLITKDNVDQYYKG
jgi:ABC-type sugar transport system, periplasmic component